MGDAVISLLGGLTGSVEGTRRRNEEQARLDTQQQQSIFKWLLQSDDPATQAIGLAGLLEPPKKSPFGHLKKSPVYEEALRVVKDMMEAPGKPPPPIAPSPPPPAIPGAAGMPDVPPLTGGGGATGPVAGLMGGAPPLDWPAGVPAVEGGPPPAAPPPAAPAAPSTGPPPAAPMEMAAAAVPQGPPPEQVVQGFLGGRTPEEALAALQEMDPRGTTEGLRPLRGLLQAATATGASMEDVLGQVFPKMLTAETQLSREGMRGEVRRVVAQANISTRVWETIFKTNAKWEGDRKKGAEAMARLEKALEAKLKTGGGTWEDKLKKSKWAAYADKVRTKITQTKVDFVALETGIGTLRKALAAYTDPKATEYEKQKAYNNFTLTVESMLGTVAKANDEGKRISDKDADRFRGALKPFLLEVGPDAWARFDPDFALERLDLTQTRLAETRDAKLKEYYDDLEQGPGVPTRPLGLGGPPEPEGKGAGPEEGDRKTTEHGTFEFDGRGWRKVS